MKELNQIKNYTESEKKIKKLKSKRFYIKNFLYKKSLLKKEIVFFKHSLIPMIPIIFFLYMMNGLYQKGVLSLALISKNENFELIKEIAQIELITGIMFLFLILSSLFLRNAKYKSIDKELSCEYLDKDSNYSSFFNHMIVFLSFLLVGISILNMEYDSKYLNRTVVVLFILTVIWVYSSITTIYSFYKKKNLKKEIEIIENKKNYKSNELFNIEKELKSEKIQNKQMKEAIVANPKLMKEIILSDSIELKELVSYMEKKSTELSRTEEDRVSSAYEILYGEKLKTTVIIND